MDNNRKPSEKKTKDILVLFSFKNHKYGYIEKLFARLTKATEETGKLKLFRGSLKELNISVIDNHLEITEALTGRRLDSFSAVYFELWYKARQQALAAARYCQRHQIPFLSGEMVDLDADTKIGEIAVLADSGINLPNTFTSSRQEIKQVFRSKPPFDYPLIVKADDGYGGRDNYLVYKYNDLKTILDANKNITFVVQEFIPNNCDYRCLVLGGEIKFVLRRTRDAKSGKHTNNTSSGAEGVEVPLGTISPEAQNMVIRSAQLLERDVFAGVDLVINQETNQPYILEVNQTPQIETGAAIDRKMAVLLEYVEKIAK